MINIGNSTYNTPPALGWQENPFTSTGAVKRKYIEANVIITKMYYHYDTSALPPKKGMYNAFSYYKTNLSYSHDVNTVGDTNATIRLQANALIYKKIRNSNFSKYTGYVPVIGTFIGAGRIICTIRDSQLPIKNKVAHIIRGTVEFLSLGFLLFIPDLILSNNRDYHAKLTPC